jgi:hypothetical protein
MLSTYTIHFLEVKLIVVLIYLEKKNTTVYTEKKNSTEIHLMLCIVTKAIVGYEPYFIIITASLTNVTMRKWETTSLDNATQ